MKLLRIYVFSNSWFQIIIPVTSKSGNPFNNERLESCLRVCISHRRPDIDTGWERNNGNLLIVVLPYSVFRNYVNFLEEPIAYFPRLREREREREREERNGEVVRDTRFWGGVRKKETIFPVLKVPRQCPLVLLVEGAHMVGIRFFIILFFYIFIYFLFIYNFFM
jgi:hypothetical protein